VGIAHEQKVRLRRRAVVGRDLPPDRNGRIACKVVEDLRPRGPAARQPAPHLDVGIGGEALVALVAAVAHASVPAGGAIPRPFLAPCLTRYIAASARRISAASVSGCSGRWTAMPIDRPSGRAASPEN